MYSHRIDDQINHSEVTNSSVSVVIACYKQGMFVAEAIESAVTQTHPPLEIIVVDDGSPDDTASVVARYPTVRYVYQPNQGVSAARNTGLKCASGKYLNFLDADDRLLPHALETGAKYLDANPSWAFVAGKHWLISENGSRLPAPEQGRVVKDYYRELMHHNFIACHDSVMYRRDMLLAVGGFDSAVDSTEDWDLYLRIAQKFPVYCHDEVVSEYRQHSSNTSRDLELMRRQSLKVLELHLQRVQGDEEAEAACKRGLDFQEQRFRTEKMIGQMRANVRAKRWRAATRDAVWLFFHEPLVFTEHIGRKMRKLLRG